MYPPPPRKGEIELRVEGTLKSPAKVPLSMPSHRPRQLLKKEKQPTPFAWILAFLRELSLYPLAHTSGGDGNVWKDAFLSDERV